jgi:hypothetical protein
MKKSMLLATAILAAEVAEVASLMMNAAPRDGLKDS